MDICADDWAPGVTDAASNVEPFENYNITGCNPTSELYKDGEDTIIGRFGKYIIWNICL